MTHTCLTRVTSRWSTSGARSCSTTAAPVAPQHRSHKGRDRLPNPQGLWPFRALPQRKGMVAFRVLGAVQDWNTFYCEALAKKIVDKLGDGSTVQLTAVVEFDYWQHVDRLVAAGASTLIHFTKTNLVMRDHEVIGDIGALVKVAGSHYNIEDAEVANTVVFNRMVRETSYHAFKVFTNPLMSIQFVAVSGPRDAEVTDLGTIIVELYADRCPKACNNFQQLCEGYRDVETNKLFRYQNCPVNRIVKNGWAQTGDFVDGSGRNSMAVVDGGAFSDESFSVDFGFPRGGILGYANEGAHSNRSQFFVTLGPCEWMNNKFVGFARVVQGFSVLRKLNAVPTSNQVPTQTVRIGQCARPAELVPPGK